MTKKIETLDWAQATERLTEILERWPLYRELRFNLYPPAGALQLPEEVTLYCSACDHDTKWEGKRMGPSKPHEPADALYGGLHELLFICRNCGKSNVIVSLLFDRTEEEQPDLLVKVGQWPAMGVDPPKELKLEADDLEFYKKAIRSRNFGYGLGAVAYLRRVVENRMSDLIDLLADEASPEQREKIMQVRNSRVFDDKVTFAAGLVPKHLRPGGVNPIDRLHDLASGGLHEKTEDECIEIFDACRGAFEYVFRQLQVERSAAKGFLESIKKMEALRKK